MERKRYVGKHVNIYEQQIRESLAKDPDGRNIRQALYATANPEYKQALLSAMGYTDPRTHMTRVKLLVDLVANMRSDKQDVMPPLLALATLRDAQWVLSSLGDIDPSNEHLDQLREMADRQTHETLAWTGSLDYEEIEDAVLVHITPSLQSKEPKKVRIDFDWTFEDGHPACTYRVYEVLGPDPRVHDAVLAFLAENAPLVGRAETGAAEDIQELLARAATYVHDRTGLVEPEATLESLLNQTALGARFLTPTET